MSIAGGHPFPNPSDEHSALLEFFYSCPLALAECDRRGAIARVNPAFSRLLTPLLTEGGRFDNLVTLLGPVLPELGAILNGAGDDGTVCDGVMLDPGADRVGRGARVLSLTVARIAADRFIAALSDVTERHRFDIDRDRREVELRAANAELERLVRHFARAREAAEQANRSKTRLLAGMSHELRTPLNGILGYSRLLLMDGGLSRLQMKRLNAMREAGEHLLEMIHSLLDLSEIDTKGVTLQISAVEIGAFARACLDIVRPMAELKGLDVRLIIASGVTAVIFTDPTRLRQVLLNLLGNAVKFTREGAIALRVAMTGDRSRLRFEVSDTGPGIPIAQRHRLFTEFERLDNVETRQAEGAGLGLSLALRLARVLNGHLEHFDNPGGGSVFRLDMPLEAGASAEAAPASGLEPPSAAAGRRPLHVLVVDDIEMNREIAAAFIESGGHSVECAEGGAAAVTAAAAGHFDVVLMDVRMPEIDGLEATRRIRRMAGPRGEAPIMALTTDALPEQVAACRMAGMDGHLAKPFTPDALLDAVARIAARGRHSDAPPPAGADKPILDPGAFERTARMLQRDAVGDHLLTLAAKVETLLAEVRAVDAIAGAGRALAPAAHGIAGSAGMFGFTRLAIVARGFEYAMQADAGEAQPFQVRDLGAALEATLPEIRERARTIRFASQ